MADPLGLGLLKKIMVAAFRITAYTFIFITEAVWSACHGQTADIGRAWGEFGRAVTNAIADMLK